jgi:hypothetical protein
MLPTLDEAREDTNRVVLGSNIAESGSSKSSVSEGRGSFVLGSLETRLRLGVEISQKIILIYNELATV